MRRQSSADRSNRGTPDERHERFQAGSDCATFPKLCGRARPALQRWRVRFQSWPRSEISFSSWIQPFEVKVRVRELHELFSREWVSILSCRLTFFTCLPSKHPLRMSNDVALPGSRQSSSFCLWPGLDCRRRSESCPARTSCSQPNALVKCC